MKLGWLGRFFKFFRWTLGYLELKFIFYCKKSCLNFALKKTLKIFFVLNYTEQLWVCFVLVWFFSFSSFSPFLSRKIWGQKAVKISRWEKVFKSMKKQRDKNGSVGHNFLGCRWKLHTNTQPVSNLGRNLRDSFKFCTLSQRGWGLEPGVFSTFHQFRFWYSCFHTNMCSFHQSVLASGLFILYSIIIIILSNNQEKDVTLCSSD